MEKLKENKKTLVFIIILVLGLLLILLLVQKQQETRSKAAVQDAVQILDTQGNAIPYGAGKYTVHNLHLKIRMKDITQLQ